MKTFIIIVFTLFLFSSCSDTSIEPENPLSITTAEILENAKADSNCYKVVYLDSKLFVIEDEVVKYRLYNHSGVVDTLALFIPICIILGFLIGKID